MIDTETITITVSRNLAIALREAVASGRFASIDDCVSARFEDVDGDDGLTDEQLRRDVLPVYEAMQAQPSRGIPAEQAYESFLQRHPAATKPESAAKS